MKRIYIAVILLIITAGICSYEFLFVSSSVDNYTKEIKNIERAYSQSDFEKAGKLTQKIKSDWLGTVSPMDTLLYHDYVDSISNNISKLSVYINQKDTSAFYCTCAELKNQLNSLKNSEIPNLENIV